MLNKEQLEILGMNTNSDRSILPSHYQYVEEPFYKGDGQLSVAQLEELLKKFTEYTHQQKIIKAELIKHILEKELDSIKTNEEETCKKILKDKGFYSNTLWSVWDVKKNFPDATDEEAYSILEEVMESERIGGEIMDSIRIVAEKFNLEEQESDED